MTARAALLLALLALSGCGTLLVNHPPHHLAPAEYSRQLARTSDPVVRTATALIGTPYRFGGNTPGQGFDCSGLVQYAYLRNGRRVPRTTGDQHAASEEVALGAASPGDLVFFRIDDRKPDHVGIYLGERRFVHAPSSGKTVGVASLDQPYWQDRFAGARRLR